MRVLIVISFVLCLGTAVVAYGPRLSFLDDGPEAPVVAEGAEATPTGEPLAGADPAEAPGDDSAPEATAPEEAPPAPAAPEKVELAAATPTPAPAPAAPAPKPAPASAPEGGLHYVGGAIHGSLYSTFANSLDSEVADPLSMVVNRVMVWWMNPRRDLLAGDRIDVLFEDGDDGFPHVTAVVLEGQKAKKTYRAYAFQKKNDPYVRLYDGEGVEVEKRLVNEPLEEYEQVTSLLKDGRGHRGVDFKAPEGTKVLAPFSGTISRRNWSTRRNGNCLHLKTDSGYDIFFLHLRDIPQDVKPGLRVKPGQFLAWSGNTGHSTAPHLHYQVEKGGRVVDPFDLHKTTRKKLSGEDLANFEKRRAELDAMLDHRKQS